MQQLFLAVEVAHGHFFIAAVRDCFCRLATEVAYGHFFFFVNNDVIISYLCARLSGSVCTNFSFELALFLMHSLVKIAIFTACVLQINF